MIDTRKVKARMLILGLTQPIVAELMGMNVATLNAKINNNRRLYVDEHRKLVKILKLNTVEEQRELLGVALI